MAAHIGNDWDDLLKSEFEKEYYQKLRLALIEEYKNYRVYPGMHDIFNALKLCSYAGVRAVILGQDPYHGDGQAHGLSFSVKKGVAIPPSLHNIYKELESDTGLSPPSHGELTDWASSGALLLNSILTVRAHEPTSHKQIGWEAFTDRIISLLNEREAPAVFILWGAYAQSKGKLITNSRHLILSSPHPSPLSASRGFFGSKPFSRANEFLRSIGNDPIDWAIKEL